jgi:hypothetical protein
MSIFQDKKLILHISLEIIIIGSMTYFFHTKSKSLELRVKSIEEQFSKEISILQDSISQLKKQLKKSEMSIEEIKYSKNVQASNQSLPILKKNGSNRVDTNRVDTNSVDTNRVDTNRVEKNRVDTNKDEFESIVFNTFSISQGPPGPVYRQHATVELIDDIVENKERNDKENKEENNNEEEKEEKEEKEETDNSSENGSLDRELENELKELEN